MSVSSNVCDDGRRVDISVRGRFDFKQHGEFLKSYQVDVPRNGSYIVDLGEVDHLDSSALGMLLLLNEHATRQGASVAVRNAGDAVRRVLQIARFEQFMEIG